MNRGPCPDCGVHENTIHINGCDVERCAKCGGQLLTCNCYRHNLPRVPWSGEWPGKAECREYGFWCRWQVTERSIALGAPGGWERCEPGDPCATEDLNRLHEECVWNQKLQRFVKPEQSPAG